jgi:hypothetical protein
MAAAVAAGKADNMAGGGQNVYDASAAGLGAAGAATSAALGFNPGTLQGTDIQAYQNPYTQQVIDAGLGDIERSRQMAVNDTGAAATAAGAFGGSRHGVAESLTNDNYARQATQFASGQRQAGFNNAQQGAMFDIGNRMGANAQRLQAAGQLAGMAGQAFGMGQDLNQSQMQQGLMQQALQQQIINAGAGQYQGWANAPQTALTLPLAALGAIPSGGGSTTTERSNPGLLSYLQLGAGLLGG